MIENSEEAHALHSQPCSCKLLKAIDHDADCAQYATFYHKLVDSKNQTNSELVSKNKDTVGFLRPPTEDKS